MSRHRARVSRLDGMAGIGVDRLGDLADRAEDPALLRLENLDTDLRPPRGVVEATRRAADQDDANSYLPFLGLEALRRAAAARVSRDIGLELDPGRTTLISTGGLNGILDTLLAILEPGDEVILPDPIYIGLINRVRLAGGVPVFLPYEIADGAWRLDRDRLPALLGPKTRAFLMMSPSMPAGGVLSADDWRAVCAACVESDAWMVYDSAMEHILFDGAEHLHPATWPGMAERTITVGSVSKEYRMIGWRIGWVVAPPDILADIGLVSISNVVCNVGLAQAAAVVALGSPDSDRRAAVAEWQARRDQVLLELADLPVIRPGGGWSLLLDAGALGLDGAELSRRALERGRVAATPMAGWGSERSRRFLRLVFSNEPVDRLRGLGERFARILDR